MGSAEIVISYRNEDMGSARLLYEHLKDHFGADAVFMDQVRLHGGVSFPEAIAAAIRDCTVMVAVVTPVNWSMGFADRDDWVRRELSEALAAGKQVVPVRMHGAAPLGAGLPPELAALTDLHSRSIDDDDFDDDVLRVIDDLGRYVAKPAPRSAFPDLPRQGRFEYRLAWRSRLPQVQAMALAEKALRAASIERDGADNDGRTKLKGGHPFKFRMLGPTMSNSEDAPLRGYLRVGPGPFAPVELLLAEDLNISVKVGLDTIYQRRVMAVFEAVKNSTGVY
jgi:hypothetical protein